MLDFFCTKKEKNELLDANPICRWKREKESEREKKCVKNMRHELKLLAEIEVRGTSHQRVDDQVHHRIF